MQFLKLAERTSKGIMNKLYNFKGRKIQHEEVLQNRLKASTLLCFRVEKHPKICYNEYVLKTVNNSKDAGKQPTVK